MSNSTLIIDYIGYGAAASRPVTPSVASGVLALWYSTDTQELDGWTGAAWVNLTSVGGAAGNGIKINSGTVSVVNSVTMAATAAGTTTISPGSGTTDVIVNMFTGAGTVTLAAAPTFQYQKAVIHIKQGSTPQSVALNSGFVFPTSGGPTSFTVTATASVRDEIGVHSPDGTHWVIDGILQGIAI